MTAVIAGGGAMGSIFAHALSHSDEISIVEIDSQLVSVINSTGIRVERSGTTKVVRPRATSAPSEIGTADVLLLCVKAHQTRPAVELVQPIVTPDTTVVSLQNGWGNADIIAEYVSPQQLVVGVTYNSATVQSPGQVSHTGVGPTFVGPFLDGADLTRAEDFADRLRAGGLDVSAGGDTKAEIWKKLVLNAATLPTSALTRLKAGVLGKTEATLQLVDALASEAVSVANALGFDLDLDERLTTIHEVLERVGEGKASMLQDVEAMRKTEIEVVNGAVVRAGETTGVATPLNAAMEELILGLERSWQQ